MPETQLAALAAPMIDASRGRVFPRPLLDDPANTTATHSRGFPPRESSTHMRGDAPADACATLRPAVFDYDGRLAKVERLVARGFHGPLTLEQAAAAANLETTYFSRYFHRAVGIGFRDWLAAYRLDVACRLMRERRLSILRVAALAGFGDVRRFERACRRHAGSTPRELRLALRPKAGSSPKPASARDPSSWTLQEAAKAQELTHLAR